MAEEQIAAPTAVVKESVVEDAPPPTPPQNAESSEEKVLDTPEEKTVEVAEEKKVEDAGTRESVAEKADELSVPGKSFKEESYRVGDLRESEKKALEEFKIKVEEAIKARAFEKPPPKPEPREIEAPKSTDEVVKKDDTESQKVEAEAKPEETVPPPEASVEESKAEVLAPPSSEPVVTETESEKAGPEGLTEVPPEAVGEDVVVDKVTRVVAIEEKEEAPPLEDYSLWGVPLLHAKGDERTDVILLKFLRARDYKVNEAFDMLRNTVIWRKEFSADTVVEEDLGSDFNTVAYVHGYDKDGHPVCYNDYGLFYDKDIYNKTFADETNANKFLRWRVQVVEKSIKKLNFNPGGVHSLVQVTDLKHSPGFLKWINITNKALTLLQDNYPELVAKQIFINVPWYFNALYSIYGRLITQRQKSKVVVARPGKVTDVLFKYISPEHVPVKYGGFSRPNDTEFEGAEVSAKDIIIKAGEKQTIEIPVQEHGVVAIWDLVVVGWDVEYGEEFVPSAEGGYTVIVSKSKRLASSEEPIRNSFKVAEPGKILLTIDNSASRRKKSVYYRHLIKKPKVLESY